MTLALAAGCGFVAGCAVMVIATVRIVRREINTYRRMQGITIDFTHRSRS